jgi:hypothetical protein
MGKRSRRRQDGEDAGTADAAAAATAAPPAADDGTAEPAGDAAPSGRAGEAPAPTGRHPERDRRLYEVSLLVEEADYLGSLYRWILLTGEVPRAQDWLKREDWPHPDYVIDVFGSWEKFLAHAGIPGSPLLARVREADAAAKDLQAREQRLEKDAGRVDDLRRQLETAKRRRAEAEDARADLVARAERAERALRAAEARAADAEERLAERHAAATAAAAAAGTPDAGPDARVAALEDELATVRAHRDELLVQVEEGRDAAERDARTIARLSALLSQQDGAAAQDGAADAEPPQTVLEAVERAGHLVFTDAARESAADSPYRRPVEILETLHKLDDIAGRFAAGEMGASLAQAATEAGLTWRQNVSELARSRNPHAYAVTHDGHRLELGPHVALGSGSGAGFIARIYLHVADGSGDVPRGLYVGHVGRHLPDTTT